MFRLKEECSSINTILDQVKYRSEWIKYQEAQRRKEEEELEKERGRYMCVRVFVNSEEIRRVQPTKCNGSQFIYICKTLCMFRTVFPFIIRSSELHIQRQVLVRPIPDAVRAVLSS